MKGVYCQVLGTQNVCLYRTLFWLEKLTSLPFRSSASKFFHQRTSNGREDWEAVCFMEFVLLRHFSVSTPVLGSLSSAHQHCSLLLQCPLHCRVRNYISQTVLRFLVLSRSPPTKERCFHEIRKAEKRRGHPSSGAAGRQKCGQAAGSRHRLCRSFKISGRSPALLAINSQVGL